MNYEDIANILMELIPKKNVCILHKLQVFLQIEEYHSSDEFLYLRKTKGFVLHKEPLRTIETLLCFGYVINIIKYGRFIARGVNNLLQDGRYKNMQYQVAFLE